MADLHTCVNNGHDERAQRKNKKFTNVGSVDLTKSIILKESPSSTPFINLKDIETKFEETDEWKDVKEGGVLPIPVLEYRLQKPPRPNPDGKVEFEKKKKKQKTKTIDSYSIAETTTRMATEKLI